MVTRPTGAANRDAAIHVAHALTVHEIERELDYMTVVEDLRDPEDDAGAAGLFDMELASGLYYGVRRGGHWHACRQSFAGPRRGRPRPSNTCCT